MAWGFENFRRKPEQVAEQAKSVPLAEDQKQKERKTKVTFTSDQSKVIDGVLRFKVGDNWYSMNELSVKHPRIYDAAHEDGSLYSSLLNSTGF